MQLKAGRRSSLMPILFEMKSKRLNLYKISSITLHGPVFKESLTDLVQNCPIFNFIFKEGEGKEIDIIIFCEGNQGPLIRGFYLFRLKPICIENDKLVQRKNKK